MSTLAVVGSVTAQSIAGTPEALVNTVMERDASGDSKAKTFRAETGLRSDGHLFVGSSDEAANFSVDTGATIHNVSAATGAITAALGASATYRGQLAAVVKNDTSVNAVTVDGDGTELVGVLQTFLLKHYGDAAIVGNTGAAWQVLAHALAVPIKHQCLLNADCVDQTAFICDRAYQLVGVLEIRATAGTDGGAVTLSITKDTGTQAPGAGTALLTDNAGAGFNMKATANTLQTGTLTATAADKQFAAGDRVGFNFAGTVTSLAGVMVVLLMRPI